MSNVIFGTITYNYYLCGRHNIIIPMVTVHNYVWNMFQIGDFQLQIRELEEHLSQKIHETEVLHKELKLVKEFRKKRAQMQRELDEVMHNTTVIIISNINHIGLITV